MLLLPSAATSTTAAQHQSPLPPQDAVSAPPRCSCAASAPLHCQLRRASPLQHSCSLDRTCSMGPASSSSACMHPQRGMHSVMLVPMHGGEEYDAWRLISSVRFEAHRRRPAPHAQRATRLTSQCLIIGRKLACNHAQQRANDAHTPRAQGSVHPVRGPHRAAALASDFRPCGQHSAAGPSAPAAPSVPPHAAGRVAVCARPARVSCERLPCQRQRQLSARGQVLSALPFVMPA